mmetsp:Transcript_52593/g.163300  ORF Transcript_52593/g.163300 Transcript_52593/m.163300 type:complete len:203 (+) Transcript_52593:539-1147(+)
MGSASCRSMSKISGKAGFGTARSEVPVSTTARQPSSQYLKTSSSMRTDLISSIQCPCSGSSTGFQRSLPWNRLRAYPPKLISLPSASCSARKTENMLGFGPPYVVKAAAIMWAMLNSGACERPERPSPRTPSKWKVLNGSSDILVARIILMGMQPSQNLPAPALSRPCRQSLSSTKTPVTSPVPKETVIWSRGSPLFTVVPS